MTREKSRITSSDDVVARHLDEQPDGYKSVDSVAL